MRTAAVPYDAPEVGVVQLILVGEGRHHRVHVAVDPALGTDGEVGTGRRVARCVSAHADTTPIV